MAVLTARRVPGRVGVALPPQVGFLGRRVLQSLFTLWLVATITFILFRLLPGDPAQVLIDPLAGPAAREALRAQLGLDRPAPIQYVMYLGGLVRGDLGVSFQLRTPVLQVVAPAFLNTLVLALLCYGVSFTIGTFLGIAAAWMRGTAREAGMVLIAVLFRSAPTFWVGAVAMMLFSVQLNLVPLSGMRSTGAEVTSLWDLYVSWDFVHHAILPVAVGSVYFVGFPLLLMRNSMLEVLGEEYIALCRAKGLGQVAVVLRHAARNAIIPVVTASALFIGWAVGGLIVLEYLFTWPGLGRQVVQALDNRDYPVAQAAFIFISVLVVLLNFIADIVTTALDPRIELT